MAEILIKILGNKLYTLPNDYLNFEHYPSPNKLKNKVIIKDKGKLPGFLEKKSPVEYFNEVQSKNEGEIQLKNEEVQLKNEDKYLEQKSRNFLEFKELKFRTVFERYEEKQRFVIRPKQHFFSLSTEKDKRSTTLSKGNNQLEANEIEIEFIKKLPEIIDFNPVNNSKKMISAENPVSSGTLDLNFPGNSKKILPTENDMIKSKLSNFPQVESISSQNQEKC